MRGKVTALHRNLYTGEITEETLDLDTLFDLEEEGFDQKLKDQPGLVAWVGVLLASAEYLKTQAEEAEKDLRERYYLQLKNKGEKTTDKVLTITINRQSKVLEAREHTNLRTQQHTQLKAIYEAVKDRGRLLQTIAANMRLERYGMEGRDSK